MTVAALIARLALAAIFVLSGVAKLRDREGATKAARDFGVPSALSGLVGAVLPVAELATAGALLAGGPAGLAGGVAAAAMLGAFTVAIVANLALGRRPDCHCFGELSTKPLRWTAALRNVALLALSVPVIAAGATQPYALGALRDRTATELTVGVALTALTLAIGALAAFCLQLLKRYGAVLLRIEDLEAVVSGADRRAVAPDFDLAEVRGGRIRLADLATPDRPALLVFTSSNCAPCQALAPDVARWAEEASANVAVLGAGTAEDVREKFAGEGALRVLHDDAGVAAAYGADATPAAVLVTPDGRVTGGPAFGAEAIVALVSPFLPHQHVHTIEPRPLGEGDPAPDVTLRNDAGERVDPARLADEAVLLFWDPTCGFAERIKDDVVAWEDSDPPIPLVLVTRGDPVEVRASGLRAPLVLDPTFAAGTAYGAPGTPSAVAVRKGTLASPVAVGGPDVLSLLAKIGSRSSLDA